MTDVESNPTVHRELDGDKFGTFRDFSNNTVKHFDKIALFYKELH